MNKYALRTIVGTALLGLAKKSSGSSVKISKFSLYTIEYSYSFGLDHDFYWDLIDNPELKNDLFDGFYQKCSDIDSVDIHLNLGPGEMNYGINYIDEGDDDRRYIDGYIVLTISVKFRWDYFNPAVNHKDPASVGESIFNTEKNKFIQYMREEWQLDPNWERSNTRTIYGDTGIFAQRNGEWVPYNPANKVSKLRKR